MTEYAEDFGNGKILGIVIFFIILSNQKEYCFDFLLKMDFPNLLFISKVGTEDLDRHFM